MASYRFLVSNHKGFEYRDKKNSPQPNKRRIELEFLTL